MWQYNYTDELYHYGVKGMRWGHRKQQKLEKKFSRVGKKLGVAEYERSKGAEEYKKHESSAKVFDKQAKKYESQGSYIKAELARKAASGLRTRGANIKAQRESQAKKYELSAERLKQKASAFATKKKVNLGKSTIDNILKESKKKGFDKAKNNEEWQKESDLYDKLGDYGYYAYNKIRGKS